MSRRKQREGEDPQHSRDIQSGAVAGVAHPVVTEDLATAAAPQTRTGRSITEAVRNRNPVSTSMGPSDSHSSVLFDQVLDSNDRARAQAQEGGDTSGNTKEKRFLCMFSNKGFSCPQKGVINKSVHTGVKSFSCTQCHMRFAQSGNLKRHQRVHTGEKPFSCTQCQMRFAQAGHLKRHQRVHTGEKPYSCPQCEKRFSHQHHLKMHLNVHTGERPFREEIPQDTPAEKPFHSNIESNHSTR
nr:zinc finger protein 239-like [Oncorhynchus nerka]